MDLYNIQRRHRSLRVGSNPYFSIFIYLHNCILIFFLLCLFDLYNIKRRHRSLRVGSNPYFGIFIYLHTYIFIFILLCLKVVIVVFFCFSKRSIRIDNIKAFVCVWKIDPNLQTAVPGYHNILFY